MEVLGAPPTPSQVSSVLKKQVFTPFLAVREPSTSVTHLTP